MLKKIILLFCFLYLSQKSIAQELICQITINTDKIQSPEKAIYEAMKTSIFEFMNNRKWTNDEFKNEEKIECSLVFAIEEKLANDEYKTKLTIQARRPVFKSSYYSPTFKHMEDEIIFKYAQSQNLEYSENAFTSQLTSVLAYYAYVIIGNDYDSFSMKGGTPYFLKAQSIAENARSSGNTGWVIDKGARTDEGRLAIVTAQLDNTLMPLRECIYQYHRKGLDEMYLNRENGRAQILAALQQLDKITGMKQNSFNIKMFFNAKVQEIANVFSEAPSEEKTKVLDLLKKYNPSNMNIYEKNIKP